MNIGGGIGLALAALALLTGLAAVATFIALGTQRGRVERLESRNDGLEKEVGDWKRRHDAVVGDLDKVTYRSNQQQSKIDHLEGTVETLSTIPLAAMSKAVERAVELIGAHHKEAMHGQEMQMSVLLDIAHMLGDKRDRRTIAEAMREENRSMGHGHE